MSQPLTRRQLLQSIPMVVAGVTLARVSAQGSQGKEAIQVYKDPGCECCTKWVTHMEANGFAATVTAGDMRPIKARFKIPANLESCHTTILRGIVIEGHVPAEDVKRFLKERPKGIVGLTIPGMPASAPGMDGKPFRPYEVLAFDTNGKTTVYAKHDKG